MAPFLTEPAAANDPQGIDNTITKTRRAIATPENGLEPGPERRVSILLTFARDKTYVAIIGP